MTYKVWDPAKCKEEEAIIWAAFDATHAAEIHAENDFDGQARELYEKGHNLYVREIADGTLYEIQVTKRLEVFFEAKTLIAIDESTENSPDRPDYELRSAILTAELESARAEIRSLLIEQQTMSDQTIDLTKERDQLLNALWEISVEYKLRLVGELGRFPDDIVIERALDSIEDELDVLKKYEPPKHLEYAFKMENI